jgi:hypothetical protein
LLPADAVEDELPEPELELVELVLRLLVGELVPT